MGPRAFLAAGACLLLAQAGISAMTVVWAKRAARPAPAAVQPPPVVSATLPSAPPPVLPPSPPVAPPAPAAVPEDRIQEVIRKAAPSLLHIENPREGSTGSGFVADAEGHALTNAHVVGEAKDVKCLLGNGLKVVAKVLARDYELDLAVLKLDLRNEELAAYVKPLSLGRLADLRVGDPVLALGSPYGMHRSAARGILSNIRRSGGVLAMPKGAVSGLLNTFLQTDAAINPGNSGGPLLDLDGRVVGVNSRGFPMAEGLGMAIPSDVALDALARLKALPKEEEGRRVHRVIGVELAPFDPDDDEAEWAYKLEKGVKVACVFPDSPAEEAGLKKGDILVRISGEEVDARLEEDLPQVYARIDAADPEKPIEIQVQREEPVVVQVKGVSSRAFYQSVPVARLGIYARAPYDNEVRGQQGAVVTGRVETFPGFERDSQVQFQVGDVVRRVDGVPVRSFEAFYDQIRSAGGPVPARLFEVVRGRKTVNIPFPYESAHKTEPGAGED